MDDGIKATLDAAYRKMEDSPVHAAYAARHGIASAPVLTISDDETAHMVAEYLDSRIAGKTVVEIGGGIGLLAMHLAFRARKVFCIEANPVWSTAFIASLMEYKPKNLSFLFGAADEFAGHFKADVALFCTHSGVDSMTAAARLFAPVVIDVHGELIAANPDAFDPLAIRLRPHA